jgi:hypothetical protein
MQQRAPVMKKPRVGLSAREPWELASRRLPSPGNR